MHQQLRRLPLQLNTRRSRLFSSASSIDPAEVAKFAAASSQWWNPRGEFAMLHMMNPVRTRYIRDQVLAHLPAQRTGASPAFPLKSLRVLDVGCGGGLLSESLARLGANVTALDASPENIAMATHHASLDPMLRDNLSFKASTAEDLLAEVGPGFYDIVCSLEVVEHVNSPKEFIGNCLDLVKPEGVAVFSTINRTPTSYLFTILLAEHLLKWVPVGTHDHSKYITPQELDAFVRNAQDRDSNNGRYALDVVDVSGILYDPIQNRWEVVDGRRSRSLTSCGGVIPGLLGNLEMNYLMTVKKEPRVASD
ncbi:S-adenosyl-L-methionine-dependent methyltransferase [Obelidium mucronatum]|nr:S-adenosyl-L-methionine-dependent methyltransferase [Obelidium mucronatum]